MPATPDATVPARTSTMNTPREVSEHDRLRLGVIGTGRIARDYLGILSESRSLELVAVCDSDEHARDRATANTSVPGFASVREMLAAARLDCAVVLTPPVSHEPISMQLLGQRISVLCEKPLAVTPSAAGRMRHTAERNETLLMMASKFRYVPDLIEARDMIAGGVIGDPILFENAFCSRVDMTQRWNANAEVSGGGVLIDNGCHSTDIVRLLLGPIVRVFAHFGRRVQPIRVEDSVRMMFETATACVGLIDVSWSVDKATDHYVSIQGSQGTIQIGWKGSRYRVHDESEWHVFGSGYEKRAAISAQLANFAAAIRGREEPAVTGEDALASVRAIDAGYRSARVGRWVPLQGFTNS